MYSIFIKNSIINIYNELIGAQFMDIYYNPNTLTTKMYIYNQVITTFLSWLNSPSRLQSNNTYLYIIMFMQGTYI